MPIRVFLHHAAGQPEQRQRAVRLAEKLRRHGLVVADIRGVSHVIRIPTVRFFHEGDRSHTRALANVLATVPADTGSHWRWRISDFTHYHSPPRVGNVEVWIASDG